MKSILILAITFNLVLAATYEISYDCGDGYNDNNYLFGSPTHTSSRVRFTSPSSFYGAKMTLVKVHWNTSTGGNDVTFHFVIREIDSGIVLTSNSYVAPNQFTWINYELGYLNYVACSNDFYVELIPENTSKNGICACSHTPIDWRSERKDDVYFPDWTLITADFFVHVILDDSFIGVQPTTLGNLKAFYHQ